MELRKTFNEDVANYDKWRPTYVPELFEDMLRFAGIGERSYALEIGIGTGQATLPVLQTNCAVTAVELGAELAAYSRQKFETYPKLRVETTAFETFECPQNAFDLIYSATAFHWIPESVGLPKVLRLLKSGGTLALFWNHPCPCRAGDALFTEIQKVYQVWRPSSSAPTELSRAGCEQRVQTLMQYGFTDVEVRLYHAERTLDAEGYIALLNTYSDHRAMEPWSRGQLEQGVQDAICRFGGAMKIYDTMDLYLAKKP